MRLPYSQRNSPVQVVDEAVHLRPPVPEHHFEAAVEVPLADDAARGVRDRGEGLEERLHADLGEGGPLEHLEGHDFGVGVALDFLGGGGGVPLLELREGDSGG